MEQLLTQITEAKEGTQVRVIPELAEGCDGTALEGAGTEGGRAGCATAPKGGVERLQVLLDALGQSQRGKKSPDCEELGFHLENYGDSLEGSEQQAAVVRSAFLKAHSGMSEGSHKAQGRQGRPGATTVIRTHLDLRASPFLTIAVTNPEVLRAQEEWEAVDSIQPETGNCRDGAASSQPAAARHTIHPWS